jgi:hypothetical protein
VVSKEERDRPDKRREDAPHIEATACVRGTERDAAHERAHDAEDHVEHRPLITAVDERARTESGDEAQKNPSKDKHRVFAPQPDDPTSRRTSAKRATQVALTWLPVPLTLQLRGRVCNRAVGGVVASIEDLFRPGRAVLPPEEWRVVM